MYRLSRCGCFLATLSIIMLAVPCLKAQESASIKATATVLPAMRVMGIHDLMFETVIPGANKSVDKATIGRAGEFEITGHDSAEISIDLELPQYIYRDSTASMRISFNSTDASYDDGSGGGQSSPVGIFNPNGPTTLRLGDTGQMSIWIGGTVYPTITQTGGDYSADITLTASYTGN